MAGGDKPNVVAASEPTWDSEITYPIAVVTASEKRDLAQKFVDFVVSGAGRPFGKKGVPSSVGGAKRTGVGAPRTGR